MIRNKFRTLSSSLKFLKIKNRLRFDKLTESLKVGTFLRHFVLFKLNSTVIKLFFVYLSLYDIETDRSSASASASVPKEG